MAGGGEKEGTIVGSECEKKYKKKVKLNERRMVFKLVGLVAD